MNTGEEVCFPLDDSLIDWLSPSQGEGSVLLCPAREEFCFIEEDEEDWFQFIRV